MTQVDDVGRPAVPLAADEAGTLLGFLEYQRATLAWKCSGLDTDGLVATVGPSTMTLGGLLKHLTRVEDIWFSQRLHGRKAEPPWDTVPWAEEWNSAAEDTPEELSARWRDAVARARTRVAEAMADGGLDRPATGIPSSWGPEPPSLRWILVHMIEEYARHNGHADLLRESVDGATGE
jgi:uncharacterized damage-inducible protein DinB